MSRRGLPTTGTMRREPSRESNMSNETIVTDFTLQTRILDEAKIKYSTKEWAHGIAIVIQDNAECWFYFNEHGKLVSVRAYND